MNVLLHHIREGEHETQDFKHSIGSSVKIAISLCAFANGDGGRLLVGVKDNGTVRGCDPEEEKHMIEGAAQIYCRPSPHLQFKVWNTTHGKVLECNISTVENKPCLWTAEKEAVAFVRCADENIRASGVRMGLWRRQQNRAPTIWKGTKASESLLSFLHENGDSDFYTIREECALTRKETIEFLAELMYFGLISENWNGENYTYQLADD
jgi:predicted HTH transcriptional regulator